MEERPEDDLSPLEAVEEILSPVEEALSPAEEALSAAEEAFSPEEHLSREDESISPLEAEGERTSLIDVEEESISHSEAVDESLSLSRTTEAEESSFYDAEEALDLVVKVLDVPLEAIQAMLNSVEGKCVLEKLWKHLSEKNTFETQLLREEHKEEVEELRAQLVEAQEMVKMLAVPPSDVPGADRQELLRLLDRRQHEIAQLSEEWKSLSSKVVTITAEKSEFQNRLDELMSQEGALKLKEKLMEQEKDLVVTQNEWLSQELESRSAQLIQLRKERFTAMANLNSQILAKNEEVSNLTSSLNSLKESHAELEKKAESYLSSMKTTKEEHAHVEELLRVELAQQARVSDLYKKSSEEAEKRVDELLKAVEKMKALLEDVSKERDELATSLQAENIRSSTRENELVSETDGLRVELSRANDLVSSLQRKGGEVLPPLEGISAEVAALFKSGMSATHLYTKFVETMEELAEVKEERQHLLTHFDHVSKELDEKVPALQQLRRDYDRAKGDNSDLTVQLSKLQEEYEILELESRDSVLLSKSREKEISRLKSSVQDLGRQVKTLLREVEDARGGVASTSSYFVQSVDSSDISSSSQVITRELVDFRNIGELQEQNQRLLSVVRELSQQNEELEKDGVHKQTQELRDQLRLYEEEINMMKDSMEKQKELTRSIVNQRDMYRTLLAQATPLPPDMSVSFSESRRRQSLQASMGGSDNVDFDPEGVEKDRVESASAAAEEAKKALEETKEQFEAYKKEKARNDAMMQEQLEKLRDDSSEVKIDRAKLASKLEYSKERYSMLESHHKALKTELDTLRSSNSKLSGALSDHQQRLSSTMNELFSTHDKLSKLEVAHQSLKSSHELLKESERRARDLYESVCHEKHSQKELLTNLHSIQNKLEMAEFETKTRLGTQVETLEREVGVLKDQLHAEENRRSTMMDAYEMQVRDLTQRLSKTSEGKEEAEERSRDLDQKVTSFSTELNDTKATLESRETELTEVKDKVLRLEQDAGAEFRGKIRLLEHKKTDLEESVKSLEGQLAAAKSHAEEYRNLNLTYEKQIQESNETQQQFRVKMEEEASKLSAEIERLSEDNSSLTTFKRELEEQLQDYTTETSQQVADLEGQIASLESTVATLKVEQQGLQDELEAAHNDTRQFSEKAMEMEQLYQNELVQHGKSMEELLAVNSKIKEVEKDLQYSQGRVRDLEASVSAAKSERAELEESLRSQINSLEERLQQSKRENNLLHEESGKLLSRLRIMEERLSRASGTEGTTSTDSAPPTKSQSVDLDSSLSDKSMDQLWEIVRFCRHEKELAETRRDLAVTENLRHKQLLESANHELADCKEQLQRLSESASIRVATAEQHAEILKKVQNLNALSDSNILLREERDRLQVRVKELEGTVEKLEGELQPLQEANKQLTGQKDALVAEKTALRNEVQRWTTRTNQLIEQYNKVDPEEYKKLLEERDNVAAQLLSKAKELESSEAVLADTQSQYAQTLVDLQTAQEREKKLEEGEVALKEKMAKLTEESGNQQSLISKLREVGRKHRDQSKAASKTVEEQKEEIASLKKKLEEAAAPSKEPSPTTANELAEKTKELMEAKKTEEKLNSEVQSLTEKFTRAQDTISKARRRLQNLNQEKEQAVKDLDELKGEHLSLQTNMKMLESENKKNSTLVTKLQAQLKEKGTISKRKVVVSKLTAHIPSQSAPTATVKPTVTTTPTASIRPMGIQTTSAPTAHVTPTLVASQQHLLPSTAASQLPSSTAAAATVFVRSTSPQILPPTGSVSPQVQGTEISQPPRSIVNPMGSQNVSSSQSLPAANPTPPGPLVPFNETALPSVTVRPSMSPVSAIRSSPPTSSSVLSSIAPGSPVLTSSDSPSHIPPSTASLSTTSSSDTSRPALSSSGGRVATTVLPFNTQTLSPAVVSFTTSSDTATVAVSSQVSQALSSNGSGSSSSSTSSSSNGVSQSTPQTAIEGSVAVSRGKVGTSKDQRVQRSITSSGSMKRKRESDDTEEESVTGAEEEREEPGSSLEPPSSKKRHIRIIQRAQVTPSSSLMPDTQASKKPISSQLDSSQDSPLSTQVLVATTAAATIVVAETTSQQQESQSSQWSTELSASSAPAILAPAAITAVVSSPQIPMSSGCGTSVAQSPQTSAGQLAGEEEVEQMDEVSAKVSGTDNQPMSEVSGSEVAADPNLADSSEEVGGTAVFSDATGLSGPESSGMAAPSLDQDGKEEVVEEEMAVEVSQEGVAATEGLEEPTLKPADTTQMEDLQEVVVQDVGPVSVPSFVELGASEDYMNTDDDSSRLSEARRGGEDYGRPAVEELPVMEPITPVVTTSPPAQLLEDEEIQSVGGRSATEKGNDRDSEEEEEEEEEEGEVEEEEASDEEDEDEEEEEDEDDDRSFKKNLPRPQDDEVIVIESSSEEEEEEEEEDDEEEEEVDTEEFSNREDDDESGDDDEGSVPEEEEEEEDGQEEDDEGDGGNDGYSDEGEEDNLSQQEAPASEADQEQYLPEDETSIEIRPMPVQAVQRPTSIPSTRRFHNVRYGERQTSIPGAEVPMGDGVVPHTPVLQENKQLAVAQRGGAQALPSTPADQPTNIVPQLTESSLATVSSNVSDIREDEQRMRFVPAGLTPHQDVPLTSEQHVGSVGGVANFSRDVTEEGEVEDDDGGEEEEDEQGRTDEAGVAALENLGEEDEGIVEISGNEEEEEEGELQDEEEGEIVDESPVSELESQDQLLTAAQSAPSSSPAPSSTSTSTTLIRPAASSSSVKVVLGGRAASSRDSGVSTSDLQEEAQLPILKKIKPSPIVWGEGQPASSSSSSTPPSQSRRARGSARRVVRVPRGDQSGDKRRK